MVCSVQSKILIHLDTWLLKLSLGSVLIPNTEVNVLICTPLTINVMS